jgi:hypothetical protein
MLTVYQHLIDLHLLQGTPQSLPTWTKQLVREYVKEVLKAGNLEATNLKPPTTTLLHHNMTASPIPSPSSSPSPSTPSSVSPSLSVTSGDDSRAVDVLQATQPLFKASTSTPSCCSSYHAFRHREETDDEKEGEEGEAAGVVRWREVLEL